MSAVKTFRRAFRVGNRRALLSVQFAAGIPAGVRVEWDRDHPPRLAGRDLARYRQLRNAALQGIANEMGAGIAIADVGPNGTWALDIIQPEAQP